jgi:hypothetical protein
MLTEELTIRLHPLFKMMHIRLPSPTCTLLYGPCPSAVVLNPPVAGGHSILVRRSQAIP